jgi:sarcosine oxidase subunit gamma
VKSLAVSFMIFKVKSWMAMTKHTSVENNMPEFRSTFSSLIDQDGYLINQENLNCREITGKSLLVLRTSKDSKNNNKAAKEFFNIKLPSSLEVSTGENDAKCFWISPDEFWLLNNQQDKENLVGKIKLLPEGMSMTDNSAAYGILEFTGENTDNLLARWMSYDLSGSLNEGKVISTTLGQAPVFVFRENKKLLMMVRHSFSHYVIGLLKDSAKRV